MKIARNTIRRLQITDLPRMDDIDLLMEDLGPRRGSVILKCGSLSWTASWGGMPNDDDIESFVRTAPVDYLVKNLSTCQQQVPDYPALVGVLQTHVCRRRRQRLLAKDAARNLFDRAKVPMVSDSAPSSALIEACIDSYCWWDVIPQMDNPAYLHITEVIEVVQRALRQGVIRHAS